MLRKATAINQSAIEATIERWQPGMTWFDLTHTYNVAATEAGGFVHDPGALVLASPRGRDASVAFTEEFDDFEIEPGMRIMFDCHGTKDLYCWDGGKTWIVDGQPEDMTTPAAVGTKNAMLAIHEALKPGVRVSDLVATGRAAFAKSGTPDPETCILFLHGLGLSHLDQEIGEEVEGSATGKFLTRREYGSRHPPSCTRRRERTFLARRYCVGDTRWGGSDFHLEPRPANRLKQITQRRYGPDRRFQPSIDTELEYTSENLKKLWVYWRSKLNGLEMLSRGDLDPVEIPELLPYVALIEVHWEPRRFFCGLAHISPTRLITTRQGSSSAGNIPAKP